MQAVILAAGKGTRMGTLTEAMPKAMLPVGGKPLLEYKLDILPPEIDEVILVIGYFGGVIHDYFGGSCGDRKLLYVEQEVFDGTAGALWRAKEILKDRFLVMMGDDIYAKEDIQKCLEIKTDWALLVAKTASAGAGGTVTVDENDLISEIEEGEYKAPGVVGTNLFVLDTRIFEHPMLPKSAGSDEFGLPQTALAASKKFGIAFHAVPASFWIQISSPEDLATAARELGKNNLS